MSKAILPECEYCYLKSFKVMQRPANTDTDEWELVVYITCDLLDSDKNRIPNGSLADTHISVSGTITSGMLTLEETYSFMSDITTTVSGYMVWAKEEYAGYIG